MSILNDIFLEEFKSLNKLCGELDEQYGVTQYINEMKAVSEYNYRNISGWKADMQYLIHIRDIRNNLVHEEGTLNEDICTQKDIDWIRSFHERILKQSDPIAILYQNNKAKEQVLRNLNKKDNNTKENIQVNEQAGTQVYKQEDVEINQQVNDQVYEENTKQGISQAILLFVTIIMIIFLVMLCLEIMFS